MGLTRDLGRRVELVSMDPHFRNITLALYRQDDGGHARYLVHTYSRYPEASNRIEFILGAAQQTVGLERTGNWLSFPCGSAHEVPARRVFLEACKLPPTATPEPKPLFITDKKSGRTITVRALGGGVYEVTADGAEEGKRDRVDAVTGGLKKLAQLEPVEGSPGRVRFSCGQPHDSLIGLLLPRALNVRAILLEEESTATRGQLVAPSQQK